MLEIKERRESLNVDLEPSAKDEIPSNLCTPKIQPPKYLSDVAKSHTWVVLDRVEISQGDASEETWLVGNQYQIKKVQRAASCLLVPHLGDTVALIGDQDEFWIAAVLKTAASKVVLAIPQAQEITLDTPSFILHAQTNCRIQSSSVQIKSHDFEVRSHSARFTISLLQFVVKSLTTMAQQLHTFSTHIATTSRTRAVQIDEIDTLKARHINTVAEETLSQKSTEIILHAAETVQIDGKRILMS